MFKIAEYEALRATIRERGTVRLCALLAGLVAWAALCLALNALEFERGVTLVPLLVLVSTFEISFFIHTGVERVGRYLQVFYEEPTAGWEHTIMAYGQKNPGGGPDPLFVPLFAILAALNFVASFPAASRHPGWLALSLVGHVLFGWRMIKARRISAGQRARGQFGALLNVARHVGSGLIAALQVFKQRLVQDFVDAGFLRRQVGPDFAQG